MLRILADDGGAVKFQVEIKERTPLRIHLE